MNSAQIVNKLIAGTDMKMICVGELNLAVDLLKIHSGDTALDCRRGTNVHKHGGLNSAMYGLKAATACLALGFK